MQKVLLKAILMQVVRLNIAESFPSWTLTIYSLFSSQQVCLLLQFIWCWLNAGPGQLNNTVFIAKGHACLFTSLDTSPSQNSHFTVEWNEWSSCFSKTLYFIFHVCEWVTVCKNMCVRECTHACTHRATNPQRDLSAAPRPNVSSKLTSVIIIMVLFL